MENKINKVLCRIFACIMTAVAGVLLLFSLVSTTHVTGVDTVFYVGDSAWLHVMVLGALTGIGIILKKRKVGVPWAVIIIAGAAVLVLLTLYVHQAGLHPKFDQRRVMQATVYTMSSCREATWMCTLSRTVWCCFTSSYTADLNIWTTWSYSISMSS